MDNDNHTDKPESTLAAELMNQDPPPGQSGEIIDAVHEEDIWSDPLFEAFNDPVFSPAPMKK